MVRAGVTTARLNVRLLVLLGIAVLFLLFARNMLVHRVERPDRMEMRQAEILAGRWFEIIEARKEKAGIVGDAGSSIPHAGMLGAEWSEGTTTLGSLEAKRTAANPRFAALMVRLLHDAGVDSSSTVGVLLSGSFPTLAIVSLAAVQTIGARALVLSSLGASSYGANQPGATWLDMEKWLVEEGGLRRSSALLTMGAEGDSGGGLSEEGIRMFHAAAVRNGVPLSGFSSFEEALQKKEEMLLSARIHALVNVGGNQTSLGTCQHAPTLPTGLCLRRLHCTDPGRGLIERFSGRGVPFIHLLHIRNIASRYGLPLLPGAHVPGSENDDMSVRSTVRRVPVMLLIITFIVLLVVSRPSSPR